MAVTQSGGLRVGDAERERVVASLQRHYQAGRLTVGELEERTRRAFAARTEGDLEAVLGDLPPEAPSPAPAPVVSAGVGGRTPFRPWLNYGVAAAGMVGVWALSGRGYFWPAWPMLGWGLALASGRRGSWGRRCGERRSRRAARLR